MTDQDLENIFFKYYKIFDKVIPNLCIYILNKGCGLNKQKTFYDRLLETLGSSTEVKKRYGLEQRAKLKTHSYQSYDASLLIHLIDDLCSHGGYKGTLNRIKNKRNKISHESHEEKLKKFGNRSALNDIITDLMILLDEVKQAFNISDDEINMKKTEITSMCDLIIYNDSQIITRCRNNLKDRSFQLHSRINLLSWMPGKHAEISNTFIKLKMTESSKNERNKIICLTSVLETFQNSLAGCIMIMGPAGAGKTTSLNQIFNEWAKENYAMFNKLEEYDLVFFVQCREQYFSCLQQYFRTIVPNVFNAGCFKYDDFLTILKKKKILFLIDGLDEMNKNSEKLLKEIKIEFGMFHMIITSRPEGKNQNLSNILPNSFYYEYMLEGIATDKDRHDFILKYLSETCDDECEIKNYSKTLIEKMTKLPKETKSLLALPMNLLLYIYMFIFSCEDEIRQIRLGCDLLHYFSKSHIQYTKTKLNNFYNKMIIEKNVQAIIQEIEEIAWNHLLNDKLSFTQEDYEKVKNKCKSEEFEDQEKVMACFLTIKEQHTINPSYTFVHKGFQEYMAARFLQRTLVSSSTVIETLKMHRNKTHNTTLMLLGLITKENDDPNYKVEITSSLACELFYSLFDENVSILKFDLMKSFIQHMRNNKMLEKNKCLVINCKLLNIREESNCADTIIKALDYVITDTINIYRYIFDYLDYDFVRMLQLFKRRNIQCSIMILKGPVPVPVFQHLPSVNHINIDIISEEQITAFSQWIQKIGYKKGYLQVNLTHHLPGLAKLRDKAHYVKMESRNIDHIIACIQDMFSPNKSHEKLQRNFFINLHVSFVGMTEDHYNQILQFLTTNNICITVEFLTFSNIVLDYCFSKDEIAFIPHDTPVISTHVKAEDQLTALSSWLDNNIHFDGLLNLTLSMYFPGLSKLKHRVNKVIIQYLDNSIDCVIMIIQSLFSPKKSYGRYSVNIISNSLSQDDYETLNNFLVSSNIFIKIFFTDKRLSNIIRVLTLSKEEILCLPSSGEEIVHILVTDESQVTALAQCLENQSFKASIFLVFEHYVPGLWKLRDKINIVKIFWDKQSIRDLQSIISIIEDLYSPNTCHQEMKLDDDYNVYIYWESMTESEYDKLDDFLNIKDIFIYVWISSEKLLNICRMMKKDS